MITESDRKVQHRSEIVTFNRSMLATPHPNVSFEVQFLDLLVVIVKVKMGNLKALVSLICLMAFLGTGQSEENEYTVTGQVFCDTCAVGFITRVSKPIQGAKVAVQCKDHAGKQLYYTEGTTDFQGYFNIPVNGDHSHEKCEAKAISSPTSCNIPSYTNIGPVFLTSNNGVVSSERITGPFGFKSTEILAVCTSVMQEYAMFDFED
eukprot:Gb_32832 [translate_table: standard]